MKMHKKLLLIGADGADWRYINYGIEKGKLPTIKKLIEKGVSGRLKSLIPPTTFPAWMCFSSGKNPGKIGHFGYKKRLKGSYETETKISNAFPKITPFWRILNKNKLKAGIVNIPYSFPPQKTDEFMVCLAEYRLGKDKNSCYPKDLEQNIIKNIGRLRYESDYTYFNNTIEEQVKESINDLKNRTRLSEVLLKKYKSKLNLFLTIFFPDRLHHFITDSETLMEYYSELDKSIEKIIRLYNPDNVILFSDHGGGAVKQEFYINEFLIKHGFLKLKRKRRFLSKIGFNLENIQKFFAFLRLDSKIVKLIPGKILDEKIKKAIPLKKMTIEDAEIQWNKTIACNLDDVGGIFINLKGREPLGIVEKKDYDRVADEIISKLKNLRDPKTNEKLNIEAYKKEEIYSGEFLDYAPDIIYTINEWDYVPKSRLPGRIFDKGRDPGNHKLYGIFIASGKDFKKGKIEDGELIDIAPTVLKMFDIEKPKDMDGKVLNILK